MSKITVNVSKRKDLGRKVKRLRKEGIVPANIFGKKIKSLAIQIPLNDLVKLYAKAGETSVVYLKVDKLKDEKPCLISNIQNNPVTRQPIHVDFHQIDLTEKVTANIPIEFTGKAPVVETDNATIVTQVQEIEVEALPSDLPEKFTLDISKLTKIGDSITVANLEYDTAKVEVKLEADTIIVSAQAQQQEEEVEEPTTEEETSETTEEAKEETKEAEKDSNKDNKPDEKEQETKK